MKNIFWLFLLSLLLIYGCSTEQNRDTQESVITSEEDLYTVSDFTPPSGKADGPDDDNPWNSRLLSATSIDGLIWTRTNQVIADQANVPSAVYKDERIFLYHVTWYESFRNSAVVAISEDNGENWVFKEVVVDGIEEGMRPAVDPDVVLLDTGQFRMYFTSEKPGVGYPEIFSAVSDDGVHFSLEEGVRFSSTHNGQFVIDPVVLSIEGIWHLYALYLDGSSGIFHASSDDGLRFIEEDALQEKGILSNPLYMDEVYRFYGFTHTDNKELKHSFEIYSWTSEDGFTWTIEQGTRLEYDEENSLEKNFVKDPAVIQLQDGSYMMFYISAIPDA